MHTRCLWRTIGETQISAQNVTDNIMDIMDDNVMENRLGLGENIMETIACLHIRRVLAVLYFVVYILV